MKPAYVQAVLEGLSQALREGKVIPWRPTLELARWTVARVDADDDWQWAKKEAARLVQEAAGKDLIPTNLAEAAWAVVEDLHAAEDTWHIEGGKRLGTTLPGFYGVVSHAINTAAGDAVELAMSVALWNVRQERQGAELATPARRVLPLLERALDRAGGTGRAARVVIGQYLPWIMLIEEDWPLRLADRLVVGDMGGPDWDPVWGGYLTRSRLFDNVFQKLRPWYLRAVSTLRPRAEGNGEGHDRDFAPERHLALHIVVALVRGNVAPGDQDRLADLLFELGAADDLAHACWALFRDFTDAAQPIAEAAVQHLVGFWAWRVAELEKRPQSARAVAEADGLGWLFMIDALPDEMAVALLVRTAKISEGVFKMGHSLWPRLSRTASKHPVSAMEVANWLIEAELKSEYPYFNRAEVVPVLEAGLRAGDADTKKAAERLIHKLGDHGFTEFGDLRK